MALFGYLHQRGRVFVQPSRYVQVGPSSPLGAVIGRVNKSYKIQRQPRFDHRLQWLDAMLFDIQATSIQIPVLNHAKWPLGLSISYIDLYLVNIYHVTRGLAEGP